MVQITKIIQIKHDTVRSIESVSFEPRRKSGKLKYSSTVRVYSEGKVEIHMRCMRSEPFRLRCILYRLSFLSFLKEIVKESRSHNNKSKAKEVRHKNS